MGGGRGFGGCKEEEEVEVQAGVEVVVVVTNGAVISQSRRTQMSKP